MQRALTAPEARPPVPTNVARQKVPACGDFYWKRQISSSRNPADAGSAAPAVARCRGAQGIQILLDARFQVLGHLLHVAVGTAEGSSTMLSMSFSSFRRWAVMPMASAATEAFSALFHRMEAHPSGR